MDAHAVSHIGVGLRKRRASGSVILNLGRGVVPTVFWGNEDCQGREMIPLAGELPKPWTWWRFSRRLIRLRRRLVRTTIRHRTT